MRSDIYGYSTTGTAAKIGRWFTHGRRDSVKKSLEQLEQDLAPAVTKALAEVEPLPPPKATFTISARSKDPDMPVLAFLRQEYGTVPLREIDSLFGFAERSTLYGGRVFIKRELSDRDIFQLNSAGIGIRLPLSNHYVERAEYEANLPLLDKYHRMGNCAIVTNDDLAKWIKKEFPDYQVDASVIKNIKTHEKIDKALELYDSVVLPMHLNQDLEFLEKIEAKNRITLFANAGCALTCPSKLCYPSISELNKGKGGEFQCALMYKDREMRSMTDFPLQPYIDLGFKRFKLLRARASHLTGF